MKRILIGMNEIAGVNIFLQRALRAAGAEVDSSVAHAHSFGYPVDRVLPLWRGRGGRYLNLLWEPICRMWVLLTGLIRYKVFVFLAPGSIFRNNLDLPILRLFGKKIIFLFLGCSERDPGSAAKYPYGYCSVCKSAVKQKHFGCGDPGRKRASVRALEKYAHLVFAQDDLADYLAGKHFWVRVPVEKPQPSAVAEKWLADTLNILHLPSDRGVKSTELIMAALERLADTHKNVNVMLRERIPRDEVRRLLSEAHIVVDSFSGMHGVLAIEGLSYGCAVVGYTADWFRKQCPDFPSVSTEPADLYDTLVDLVTHPDRLRAMGEAGRSYYEKVHSYKAIGEYYLRVFKEQAVL